MARTEIGGKNRKVNRKIKNKKTNSKEERHNKQKRKTGPRLPSGLQKELGLLKPKHNYSESDSDEDDNAYEYEEGVAVEETKKNRRFDQVDNLEYELPEEFEDENLPSDDDFDGEEEEEEGNHARMLHDITGIPTEAFEIKKTKEPLLMDLVDVDGGDTKISIHDLLDNIQGQKGYNELRKRVNQMEKKPMALSAPLPKVEKEKIERKVAYEHSKKEITKWDPLVRRNRQAPTVYFEEDRNLGFSTVGAIAAEFQPRTEFEKKMDALVHDPKVVEAHKNDGLSLLELNEVSVEDVRERQNRLAKMRTLLFRHEMKQKRIKKIKSKTYHRILKKDKSKSASDQILTDPEAILVEAKQQEFKRAEERLTLKHKNKSKWAKRILQRGLKAQDEGTRAALAEQLHQHEMLKRKMNSMRESSGGSSSDDEEDDYDQSPEIDKNAATKLLIRAKEETNKVIEEEGEIPTGVLSLPFMARALKKKMEAVNEEAQVALQEYDKSLGKLEDVNGTEITSLGSSGRKTFGAPVNHSKKARKKVKRDIVLHSSDSEADIGIDSHEDEDAAENDKTEEIKITPRTLGGQKIDEENALQVFDGHTTSSKTTYEVALFASGSWKKVKSETSTTTITEAPLQDTGNGFAIHDPKGVKKKNELESDHEMDDGFLTSDLRPEYELPSQSDLMRDAFAGNDVELEFENDKMEVLNDENPEPEKPVLLPGWGQWTDVQQKKGMPSWMVKEHEDAKRKRDEALRKRKDALLKHVIISEKTVKHAEKLQTKSLPFPFTSKEVFEQSIRMPIGPDYNPAISVGAINRPTVIKESGIVIKPIQFEEVDPHEKDEQRSKRQKTTTNKNKRDKKKNGLKKKVALDVNKCGAI